ncbi:GM11026 [Drosophila sechellia]|uniref:GM11026 n=1 Tax=Drosophila sechellia TaxID=7238 RepID=B4I3I3_DROSE|nr:GM11026 [Drosophila sechellia]
MLSFAGTSHLATFSCTRKKKRKLVIDRHEFVMDRKLKSSINWRCARYRSSNCKVRATTHVQKNGQEVYRLKYAKHSHL